MIIRGRHVTFKDAMNWARGWSLWILYKVHPILAGKKNALRYESRLKECSQECLKNGMCNYCDCDVPQMFFVKECIAKCKKCSKTT